MIMRQFFLISIFWCLIIQVLNAQNEQTFPRDTSFTTYQAWIKIRKEFPNAQIAKPELPEGIVAENNMAYTTLPETPYGKRDLHIDLFRPVKTGIYPVL